MSGLIARPIEDRLWEKVERKESGCWEWTGPRMPRGYGVVNTRSGGTALAHRLSYMLFHGDPGDKSVLHSCDNPPCINPSHLWLGTQKDNIEDMVKKGRACNGERQGSSVLMDQDVRQIRKAYSLGRISQKVLAEEYGVSQTLVSQIVLRKIWRHI